MAEQELAKTIAVLFGHALPGTVALRDVKVDDQPESIPRARDLVWSRDGRQLIVCAEEIVVLSRASASDPLLVTAENAAGTVRLRAPPDFKRLPSRGPYSSVDVHSPGVLASGTVDGVVRVGNSVVAELGETVARIRVSSTREIAALTSSKLFRVAPDVGPRQVHEVGSGADIAWSHDGRLALLDGATVTVLEGASTELPGAGGGLAWAGDALVVTRPEALHVIARDGSRSVIERSGPRFAGRVATSPDGRYAFALYADEEGGSVEAFDLLRRSWQPFSWRPGVLPSTPIAFSPTGDLFAYMNPLTWLTLCPWDPGVVEDPPSAALSHAHGLFKEKEYVRVLDVLRAISIPRDERPSLGNSIAALRYQAEDALRASRVKSETLAPAQPLAFAVGDGVRHGKFGEGVVRAVDGTKITVDFAGTTRTLQASFLAKA